MSGDLDFDALVRPFVVALQVKRPLLQRSGISREQRARVLESMSDDLKKMCDVVVPCVRPASVSRDALALTERLGVDLCQLTWHQQQGRKRADERWASLHREHVVPILALRTACVDAADVDAAIAEVDRLLHIAWITKAEDRRLTEAGYRKTRPDTAYGDVGIELVPCLHGREA
jgi:hypothetical protein